MNERKVIIIELDYAPWIIKSKHLFAIQRGD